jgi:outer membrane protein OmpA-like peptidoglycan-associated protein
MATEVQDDYLDCNAYKANTSKKSAQYPGFITFSESNGDHFFAWVNGDEIVLRSEAYPNAEKMEKGINAILKNCDLPERYSVVQGEGGYLLLLWGGGNHQEHTGNREQHSEIGRSCPHPSREALNALLSFKGQDFADKVVPIKRNTTSATADTTATNTVVAATGAAAALATGAMGSATSGTTAAMGTVGAAATGAVGAAASGLGNVKEKATGYASGAGNAVEEAAGGSGAMKWLLPLLLVGALGAGAWYFFGRDKKGNEAPATTSTTTTNSTTAIIADTSKVVTTPTKEATMVKLADGTEINAFKGGIEDQLVNFLNNKDAKLDSADKKANWYDFDDLNFVFNKTEITEASKKQIGNLIAVMKAYPSFKFKIGTYSDKKGNDAYNLKLSQGRADAVLAAIKAGGGDVSRITKAEGYGETLAVVSETASDEERLKDRRTAIRVVSK